jgi:tRNA pseudouridine55 synthase
MDPGVYLVHKPAGATSFQVLKATVSQHALPGGRRIRACHGGTLDPFAEGLLLVLVGAATRLMDLIHRVPKRYLAEVRWGAETDTGDPLGTVAARGDPSGLTPDRLAATLAPRLGWTDQVPPSTSAKKIGGEPAYRKVHRGEAVALPPSRVYLHTATWRSHQLPHHSVLDLTCRGGFYVRALARDLGRSLGCRAHLGALRRTEIGPWKDPGAGLTVVVRGPDVLPWARRRTLTDQEVGALRKGEALPAGALQPAPWAVPPGFPDPEAPILGLHLGKVAVLLRQTPGGLRVHTALPGGI